MDYELFRMRLYIEIPIKGINQQSQNMDIKNGKLYFQKHKYIFKLKEAPFNLRLYLGYYHII